MHETALHKKWGTHTIKALAEEVAGLLVAGLKLLTILGPILVAAALGLPRLTTTEMIATALVVVGVSFGVHWLRRP